MKPAAFIDRDGVINQERNYVHRVDDFVVLPGVVEGLRSLAEQGYALVIVTNQAGIARGLYTEADFRHLTGHMLGLFASAGVEIAAVYHCPHHPQAADPSLRDCSCRKPLPGMLLRAAREHGLDLERSILVGDKSSDIEAGRAAGIRAAILVRSGHAISEADAAFADEVCDDLSAAAQFVQTLRKLP